MSLAANALTTLSDVKGELGVSDSDSDSYLENLIDSVSTEIETFLGRKLAFSSGHVEDVAGFGGYRIRLSRLPVISLTSVEMIDPWVPSTSMDISNVSIEDDDAGWVYYRGGWPWTVPCPPGTIAGHPLAGQEQQSIRVTYDGGYELPSASVPTLPLDIRRAATISASTLYRQRGRDLTVKREQIMNYSVTYFNAVGDTATQAKMYPATSLPTAAVMMLLPHKKIAGV
jgi:hypothetical protein